jgi:hypothetical protein
MNCVLQEMMWCRGRGGAPELNYVPNGRETEILPEQYFLVHPSHSFSASGSAVLLSADDLFTCCTSFKLYLSSIAIMGFGKLAARTTMHEAANWRQFNSAFVITTMRGIGQGLIFRLQLAVVLFLSLFLLWWTFG